VLDWNVRENDRRRDGGGAAGVRRRRRAGPVELLGRRRADGSHSRPGGGAAAVRRRAVGRVPVVLSSHASWRCVALGRSGCPRPV